MDRFASVQVGWAVLSFYTFTFRVSPTHYDNV